MNKLEMPNRGRHLSEFDYRKLVFPCQGEIGAFSEKGFTLKFYHPLKGKVPGYDMDPCIIDPAPYSFCPAPYRWMMVDNYNGILEKENLQFRELTNEDKFYPNLKLKTWIDDVSLQGQLLEHFWKKLEPGKSLVVFYVNSTPAAEDRKRVVVGLGRLADKFKFSYYGNTATKRGPNYAWQRQLGQNYPGEGFRLPYQEYLEQGVDTNQIAVTIHKEIDEEFKFVAEHVSDGTLLSLADKLVNSINIIIKDVADGKVTLAEDWGKHRLWLQQVIGELWENRGQYPGIGSVLQFLGFSRGMTYHREELVPLQKQNQDILQHVIDILDGKTAPDLLYQDDFDAAKQLWEVYSSDPSRRELLMLFMRMDASEKQVERIMKDDLRENSGIKAKIVDIVGNPYLIAENDKGLRDKKGKLVSEEISLDTIDHAMVSPFNFRGKYRPDDYRRVRAIMVEELKRAAEEGDTLLRTQELMDNVHSRFQGERQCRPDLFVIKTKRKFFEEKLEFTGTNEEIEFISLLAMRNYEKLVSEKIREIVKVEYGSRNPDWNRIMDMRFGKVKNELEKSARAEKASALEVLYRSKFSVLTGRAGTGKTEVVSLLIQGLCEEESNRSSSFLVLAPTGKARIRLKQNFNKTKSEDLAEIEPKTIHQYLNKNNWLGENFELKDRGGWRSSAENIIVDECSMMAIDLFATLIKSLELGDIKRLILVGDPNQLPPIGPGRPLDDIVNWLQSEKQLKKHLANLKVRMRHIQKDIGEGQEGKITKHVCLQLADAFLRDYKSKDVEEIYALINQKKLDESYDLYFGEWKDYDDLLRKFDHTLESIGVTDYDSYRESVGIVDGRISHCESWQVLSPLKHREISGTISLNNYLQNKFLGETLSKWRARLPDKQGKRHSPFGKTKDVVHEDKVIQTRNTRQIWCTPYKSENYVANGEIGIALLPQKGKGLNVVFSDQPDVQYTYTNGKDERSVENNLELAYAITIHKAQGSDFEKVIVIIPQNAFNISMEMMYTALTRFKGAQGKTYLLVQGGIETLEQYRHASKSETDRRNTNLFKIVVRNEVENIPYAENRIHRTKNDFLVRSKSEVIVANELISAGIQLTEKNYESKLPSKTDPNDYRLPDFMFEHKGKRYYWEHLGMLSVESYKKSWERKLKWYEENGYVLNLITSRDGPNGSIDSKTINGIIQKKLGITKDQDAAT